jgi:O-antigen ligase
MALVAPFFFIPFLGGNHLSLSYVTIDRFWIETAFVGSLIIALCAVFLARIRPNRSFGRFLVFFVPFLTVCALSYLYTWNRLRTLTELNILLWVPAVALLLALGGRREAMLKTLVFGSLCCALCAVLQFKVLFPHLLDTFKDGKYGLIVRDQVVPFAAFINQNLLGSYMAGVLPIALYFAMTKRNPFYLGTACVILAVLLLSLSRLSVVIAGCSILTLAAIAFSRRQKKETMALAGVVVCGLLLFTALVYGEKTYLKTQLEHKARTAAEQISTLDKRTEIWTSAYAAFRARPLIGYGAGTFEYAYRNYFDGGLYTRYAHGTIAKVAVELGVAGLATSLLFVGGIAMALWRLIRRGTDQWLVMSVVSVFVLGLVDFSFDAPAHLLTFFGLAAGCFALVAGGTELKAARMAPVALAGLLLLSLGFTARANLSKMLLDQGVTFEENGLLSEAYVAYRDAAAEMPVATDAVSRTIGLLAKSYANEPNGTNRQRTVKAIDLCLEKAEAMPDTDAELQLSIGVAYRTKGRLDRACAHMERAVSYFPSSAYYRAEAASCLLEAGQEEGALRIARGIGTYLPALRRSGSPQGLYVYRLKEIEAQVALNSGDTTKALELARQNLDEGLRQTYAVTNFKARELIEKKTLIAFLEDRVRFYEAEQEKSGRKAPVKPARSHEAIQRVQAS